MSYSSYRTSSAPSRGRGFSTRGSFRGRGGGEGSNSSWNSTSTRGSRGGFSGPSRGRFNWYKEHSSSFDSRRSYGSGGFTGGAGASGGADRYSSRGGRAEDSYRRSYRGDVSDYSSRDHSHHRSPESQRKRMRTEHSYVQASSGRRSHEGSYGGGTDYNSRYSYEDKGYGEDRSRGYREERRSAGSFRDRSREEYPHRKAEQSDSGMPPPSSGPPRHVSSPRGSFRGRASSRGPRGMSRLTLARDKWRTDPILARKRSVMDSYSVRKRILSSRAQADYSRRSKIQKLRRMRELAAKKEGKGDKDGKTADEISEGDEEEDGELGELEDWDTEVKKEGEDEDDDEVSEKVEEKPKVKKEKKVKTEEEREEGEEVDEEEEEAEEEEEEKEGDKPDTPKKSEKNGGVHVTIKQDSDSRAVSEEVKRTTFHGKPFIRLTCPHCFMRCITFKEYSMHLYSSKHIIAMRKQSSQLKQTLARMRMTQRQKQRIVEENEAAQGSLSSRTRFCPICKSNYRQFKTKHQISDYHRAMKKFLMPYCRICRIGFKSPMLFENHICSLEHIKREARMKESMRFRERSRDDGSGIEDEDKEVNLDNFMTSDSVGTVDDDGDEEGSDGDGKGKSDKDKKESDEKKRTETNLGSEYIKKVEVLFCEMCRSYLPRLDQPERALSIHCRSRPHLTRYVRYRDDRSLRREAERIHQRKEAKDNADGEKSDKKKEAVTEKTIDSTTEKEGNKDGDVEMKDNEDGEDGDADASQEVAGEEGGGGQAGGDAAEGGEELDQELEGGMDDKSWDDVDKDLGDLLREVEPGNKSSDEDEDSRAEGGRYDRFRYSEKGSTGPHAEGDAPDTTKAAVDGEGEGKSEAAEEVPAKEIKVEPKDETDSTPKKQSPSGGAVSSAPVAVTTN